MIDGADLPADPQAVLPAGASILERIAARDQRALGGWLDGLHGEQLRLLYAGSWALSARAAQIAPEGDWRTWLILAGRGFGKTRAGAEWVMAQVTTGVPIRIALVAGTLHEARSVMIDGESGLLAIGHGKWAPKWEGSTRRLIWQSGAQAQIFSAAEPDSLRGPQHHVAWLDEIAKWRSGEEAWANLQMGLRLGTDPRVVATTSPRAVPLVRKLVAEAGASGEWAGQVGAIALWNDGGWRFLQPVDGMAVWSMADDVWIYRNAGAWVIGELPVKKLVVGGQQVVGGRGAAIPVPSGGSTIDGEARAAIGAILAALVAHGLIAA